LGGGGGGGSQLHLQLQPVSREEGGGAVPGREIAPAMTCHAGCSAALLSGSPPGGSAERAYLPPCCPAAAHMQAASWLSSSCTGMAALQKLHMISTSSSSSSSSADAVGSAERCFLRSLCGHPGWGWLLVCSIKRHAIWHASAPAIQLVAFELGQADRHAADRTCCRHCVLLTASKVGVHVMLQVRLRHTDTTDGTLTCRRVHDGGSNYWLRSGCGRAVTAQIPFPPAAAGPPGSAARIAKGLCAAHVISVVHVSPPPVTPGESRNVTLMQQRACQAIAS